MEVAWERNLGKRTSSNKDMVLRNIVVCVETIKPMGVAGVGRREAGERGTG